MLLLRHDFEHWLTLKPTEAEVGYARDPWGCPLALYLKEKTGVTYGVTPETIRHVGWVVAAFTPDWAAEFLRLIDLRSGPITAGQALRVLRSISSVPAPRGQ